MDKRNVLIAGVAMSMVMASGRASLAGGPVCITTSAGHTVVLNALPKSTKSKAITGNVYGGDVAIVGTGFVNGSGERIIGLTEMYSTAGTHPIGTETINLPADATAGTGAYSFSGDGAPTEGTGAVNVIPCP